jgi:hypothetical protein
LSGHCPRARNFHGSWLHLSDRIHGEYLLPRRDAEQRSHAMVLAHWCLPYVRDQAPAPTDGNVLNMLLEAAQQRRHRSLNKIIELTDGWATFPVRGHVHRFQSGAGTEGISDFRLTSTVEGHSVDAAAHGLPDRVHHAGTVAPRPCSGALASSSSSVACRPGTAWRCAGTQHFVFVAYSSHFFLLDGSVSQLMIWTHCTNFVHSI